VAIWIVTLLLPVAGLGQTASSTQRATSARAYYTRCPNLAYKGRHKLFRHSLACSVAKRKARYVLKNRTNPPGWRCSLDNLSDGYAACARGKHAFEFLPL
jgi:hypothetical protein